MKRKERRTKLTKVTIEKKTTEPKEVKTGKIEHNHRVRRRSNSNSSYNSNYNKGNCTDCDHTVKISKMGINFDYSNTKVVIFCHIYYADLITEIFTYINNLKCKKEVWVSLPNYSTKNNLEVRKKLVLKECPDAKIKVVPNKGKDIGGKLVCLKEYFDNSEENANDWLIFCHDKKSPQIKGNGGVKWRRELLNSIFMHTNVQRALAANRYNKFLMWGGKVREGFVDSRVIAVHQGNVSYMKKIIQVFGIKTLPQTSAFIGGTMFWVNENFYRKCFKDINIDYVLELLESGNIKEPSYTHAIERIFGMLVTLHKEKIGII